MDAVQISNVTKTFGAVTAVDDLSLAVPPGSVYGFIGPNGSGKTTTMRMIASIFYSDRGEIRVFGKQMLGARSELIGYLPEERGLYRKMAVRPLLEFYGELRSGRNVTAEVESWLKKLDLAKWATQKVQTLSKGMSQKVQFIAAVVPAPKLLILDEPFSGLDPVSADTLHSAILDSAPPRRHRHPQHARHAGGREHVRLHLHDLPRPRKSWTARWHPFRINTATTPYGWRLKAASNSSRVCRMSKRSATSGRSRNCAWRAAAIRSRCCAC